jgi:hypothetical protein
MGRIKPKLTYANVVASIALFGVLAGGVAVAVKGSGAKPSLLRAGIATPSLEQQRSLLKLRKIGQLRIHCGGSGILTLHVRNRSGKRLQVSSLKSNDGGGVDGSRMEVADGETGQLGLAGPLVNSPTSWISIAPVGKAPRPQAMAVVNATRGCETGRVTAIGLSTEQ